MILTPAFLAGGGDMGGRIRAYAWSTSPLGLPEDWPQPLRTLTGVLLASNQPMFVAWGRRRILLYNDSYAEILGRKHPGALGQPFEEVWSEIWVDLEPIMARCYAGEPIQMDDIALVMHRHGYPEETHFAFSYTPVRDDAGGVAGVFCPCAEITAKVLEDRRRAFRLGLETALRDLSDPNVTMARVAEALARHLGVTCVGFAEIGPDGRVAFGSEFHDGRPSSFLDGRHALDGCGKALDTAIAAGRLLVVHDLREKAPAEVPGGFAALADSSLRTLLLVPLARDKRPPACLYAAHHETRRWSEEDIALVREIAERTWAAVGRARAEAALQESEARWRGLFERMHEGFALCELMHDVDGRPVNYRYLEVNAAWERLTGIPGAATVGWLADEVNPEIEPFWIETFARVVETGEAAHVEHSAVGMGGRWFEVLVYRTEPGRFALLFMNVTERKRTEERQALLAREVDHRAKNALAVVQAMVRLTRAEDVASFVRIVENRVTALARAQALLAEGRWDGADLRTLVAGELAPFLSGGQAELDGPPVILPPLATQPLAMALHELATNATKHGALSAPGGRLTVSWHLRSKGTAPYAAVRLKWEERGGPRLGGPPTRRGFGSRVIEETIRRQLGGAVSIAWEEAGLVCELDVPLANGEAQGPSGSDNGQWGKPSSS